MHYPYEVFLHNTGLTVQFLRLKWYTTSFNRTIFRWGSSCNRFLTQSFNTGVLATIIIIPIGIVILFLTLFGGNNDETKTKTIVTTSTANANDVVNKIIDAKIEILLPGINLPLEEIGFYILTLMICSIVHELGHALAAISEDIQVNGFGLHLYFCIPIAYTEINLEQLNNLKGIRKLRIFCGGIWHNIILAIFCYFLLSTFDGIFKSFYKINESVIITDIHHDSSLIGDKGLFLNDEIRKINNCHVYDIDTWYDCLLNSIKNKPIFCVSSDFIRLNDESIPIINDNNDYNNKHDIIQCCDPNNIKISCFEHINIINDSPIEIPQYICLNIRKMIEESYGYCTINNENGRCNDNNGFCIKPLLHNSTTIIILNRVNKPNVIYIGHPIDISKTVKISRYVPKIANSRVFQPKFADSIQLFLKYNIVFSLGLALINAIPCFGLDGYHIINTLVNNYLIMKIVERGKRDLLVLFICSLGTLLFFCSIIKVIWLSLFNIIF